MPLPLSPARLDQELHAAEPSARASLSLLRARSGARRPARTSSAARLSMAGCGGGGFEGSLAGAVSTSPSEDLSLLALSANNYTNAFQRRQRAAAGLEQQRILQHLSSTPRKAGAQKSQEVWDDAGEAPLASFVATTSPIRHEPALWAPDVSSPSHSPILHRRGR